MSVWRIIYANLRFSQWQHLGTCLGAALGSMILVGALTVGDSVHATLLSHAQERVGSISHLILSEEGFFHSDLSDRVQGEFRDDGDTAFAPVLMTSGTFSSPDGKTKASGLTVLGIDSRFFEFSEGNKEMPDFSKQGFWASPDLAKELGTVSGTRMILRVEEPSLFSRDAPLSGERDAKFVTWNRSYLGELGSELLGKFSLRSNMEPARTIFAPLSMLQDDLFIHFEQEDKKRNDFANLVLAKVAADKTKKLKDALGRVWQLQDGGLKIKKLTEDNTWVLRSRSIFLNDRIAQTAKQEVPEICGEFTYLINAIRKAGNTEKGDKILTPYSMVTGVDFKRTSLFPEDFQNDQVAVNKWLARDLNLTLGDKISLEYYVVGPRRKLMEENRTFHVCTILPMPNKINKDEESDWTPRFPGLSDSENCGEWDTGIPIKHEIRPKDEEYWDEYRGSPKAFITHQAAQEMWGNRWGSYTGLRISGRKETELLADKLSKELRPSDFGIQLIDFKENAITAVDGPVDFGQLFLAFGFFAIFAGLALSSLLFGFSMEQRNQQVGLLLALGWGRSLIKFITYAEVAVVSLLGSLIGVGFAWFFGQGVLWMLGEPWGGAVARLDISYLPESSSILLGLCTVTLISFVTLIWVARKIFRNSPIELMQAGQEMKYGKSTRPNERWVNNNKTERIIWASVVFLIVGIWKMQLPIGPGFFGLGGLVLVAGLLRYWRYNYSGSSTKVESFNLLQRLETPSARKITVVGMLAVGAFLVIGAGAFRQSTIEDIWDKRSGTGGYSHIFKTTIPIYDDLKSEEASALFDLNQSLLRGTDIIPVRKYDGDEANCLNLHQSMRPPLYGVPSKDLIGRFDFAQGDWSVIKKMYSEGMIPAAVDQNTMLWSMKKKLGDRILYSDEFGNDFEVVIAAVLKGSFLQGGVFISERNWLEKYPGRGGFREFWVSSNGNERSTNHLAERLFNYGVQSQTTTSRLAAFKEVENTYLSIFQSLGGLGVLLGSFGLLIVILRNLWERRPELATLHAIGFSPSRLRKIFRGENLQIVRWGLSIGAGAGLIGLLPAFWLNEKNFSWASLVAFGFSLALATYVCTVLAVHFGLKSTFLYKLRDE